ncbi:hypothetical protein ILUMI_16808, partial [Ignelater luminosus]
LEVTLRFLAAGKSFRSLMYSTRIHESTISRFVPEVLLLAMCDARYKFTYINVGANERVSDAGIFQQSSLCRAMQAVHNPLNLPKPQPLPGQNSVVPYVIIGDDAFPLGKHLLKPYPQRSMSDSSKIFNYRLSRARRMIESSFGILANRFRIFLAPINLPVENVEIITLACIALHVTGTNIRTSYLKKIII